MNWVFIDRRPLLVRDHLVSIKGGPCPLIFYLTTTERPLLKPHVPKPTGVNGPKISDLGNNS